jgi:predicted CXXCH cytochrome family protein
MKRAMLSAGAAAVVGALLLSPALGAQERFPHEKHSVFFPECTACHAGGTSGAFGEMYPQPSTCAACHDGATAPKIAWKPPAKPRASSLSFSHTPHAFDCSGCHFPGGGENLAALAFPRPETCLGCHVPGTRHQQTQDCGFCHAQVVEFRLTQDGRLPPFHGKAFAGNHAAAAASGQPECSSCHAENTCTQCHAAQKEPSFHPVNFLASHSTEAFGRVSDCTSCHSTEAFCRECHVALGFKGGKDLSGPFHSNQPLWILGHAQAARQDMESCSSCHQQTDCLRCHSATAGMRINPHGSGFPSSSVADRNKTMCKACHVTGLPGGGA